MSSELSRWVAATVSDSDMTYVLRIVSGRSEHDTTRTDVHGSGQILAAASVQARVPSRVGVYERSGWVDRISARIPARSPGAAPRARAWTSTLPKQVASAGPAITGRAVASALSWHHSALPGPPPTICTTSA